MKLRSPYRTLPTLTVSAHVWYVFVVKLLCAFNELYWYIINNNTNNNNNNNDNDNHGWCQRISRTLMQEKCTKTRIILTCEWYHYGEQSYGLNGAVVQEPVDFSQGMAIDLTVRLSFHGQYSKSLLWDSTVADTFAVTSTPLGNLVKCSGRCSGR